MKVSPVLRGIELEIAMKLKTRVAKTTRDAGARAGIKLRIKSCGLLTEKKNLREKLMRMEFQCCSRCVDSRSPPASEVVTSHAAAACGSIEKVDQ